jgi:SAP domain
MGAACQSCGGMGVLEDGSDCPECVGGQAVEREPALVGAETVLPAKNVNELPPSEATPSGILGAAATGQGGYIPGEAVKVPSSVEIVAEPEPIGGAPAVGGGGSDYASQTNADLQAELESRGLATSGTKTELVARLEEDDAAS